MTVTAERHEFQAEVQQLLDIVVHSLYSNKEIFLRELISNSSDALDKLRFEGLTRPDMLPETALHIRIDCDPSVRTLSVADNGIGMSHDELIQHIGTIAKSGTAEFLAAARNAKGQLAPELIGQFGVGFYSSFMVADRVSVLTRRAGEDQATLWESSGEGSFVVSAAERSVPGTTVTLHLKPTDAEAGINDYTNRWVIKDLVKRYSDFVAYPILMKAEKDTRVERDVQGAEQSAGDAAPADETLNSMKAIWTRPKNEVSDDEYREFYKHITHDWSDPLTHISVAMEGTVEARALLYLPSAAPLDLYLREMSYRGLQLYVKRVFIMDECRDLMPSHLRFVKGVIDAEGLPLNVSRELLQQDRHTAVIRRYLVRKIMDELRRLMQHEPEQYRAFWAQFGPVVKEGLLAMEDKRETILDLMLTGSSRDPSALTSLEEYIARMKPGQDVLYYLAGPSREVVQRSPHLEVFLERGYEVLFFTDPVDEVWLQHPPEYRDMAWQSVGRGAVELGAEEERKRAAEELQEQARAHEDLLGVISEHVKDDVKEVTLSNRLTSSPACLVGDTHDIPPQMAEMLRRMGQDVPVVKRTLELNPSHPIFAKLRERFVRDREDPLLADAARLLLGQAILAEGGELSDPAAFSEKVAELMERVL